MNRTLHLISSSLPFILVPFISFPSILSYFLLALLLLCFPRSIFPTFHSFYSLSFDAFSPPSPPPSLPNPSVLPSSSATKKTGGVEKKKEVGEWNRRTTWRVEWWDKYSRFIIIPVRTQSRPTHMFHAGCYGAGVMLVVFFFFFGDLQYKCVCVCVLVWTSQRQHHGRLSVSEERCRSVLFPQLPRLLCVSLLSIKRGC